MNLSNQPCAEATMENPPCLVSFEPGLDTNVTETSLDAMIKVGLTDDRSLQYSLVSPTLTKSPEQLESPAMSSAVNVKLIC